MMTDEEIQRVAKETGTPEAVIRTALPLIPVDKHSEWIGLLKSDNPASKMAHSYGWTVQHAISYLKETPPPPPPRKRMRLRFTIRDLLWLTAMFAIALGWWVDRDAIRKERALLDQKLAETGRKMGELVKGYADMSFKEAELRHREIDVEIWMRQMESSQKKP